MKVFFAPRTIAALLVLAVLSISGSVVTWATLSAASDTSWHKQSHSVERTNVPVTADHPPVKFDPAFAARVATVEQYLLDRPGTVTIVIHDRFTGARWSIGEADDFMPAMSTVKLAIAVDLLTREEAGELTLSKTDYQNLHLMLHESDNDAANALWNKYGAEEMLENFPKYGFTAEFDSADADNWIDLTSSAHALDDLMNYVLTGMSEPLRDYLVEELRTVAPNQQWGVWGAGADALPGNKNGWSFNDVHNSVGFAGADERYTLSMMSTGANDVEGPQTLSDVAELLFATSQTPAATADSEKATKTPSRQ